VSDALITSRERMRLALRHQEADRIPIHDDIWTATIKRWQAQGMSDAVSYEDYFGFDMRFFRPDISPRYPERVIERTTEYVIEATPYGSVRRNHIDHSTTPELIEYPVKSPADWQEAKRRLEPSYTRMNWLTLKSGYDRARAENRFVAYRSAMSYDQCQNYIRTDELLPLLITDPDWVRDIVETIADMVIGMYQVIVKEGYEFDAAFLSGDLGYRKAPFFSPRTYQQIFKPVDRRIFDFFHAQGIPVIMHSCGNVRPLIPDLIDAGLDCLQALEVKAGMDLVELKREYGRDLAFMGGIDVRAMSDPDPQVIEREIATKIPAARAGGGYIYHSDHSVPNDVSLAQYRRVLELVKKYGEF